MQSDINPDEQSPAKGPDEQRDDDGRFARGNTLGTPWGPDNPPPKSPGRPKSKTLTDSLIRHLEKKADQFDFTKKAAKRMGLTPEDVTVFEVLAASSILHGMKGKGDILREMWTRLEGQVPKHVTLVADDPVMEYLDFMRQQTEPSPPDNKVVKKRRRKVKRVRTVKHGGNGKP